MIEVNKSLKKLNSLGFNQSAERFVSVSSEDELSEMVEYAAKNSWPVFVLGGGSNIVLTKNIPGLVVYMQDKNVELISSDEAGNYIIRGGAGVEWHDFVIKTLEMNARGLENLSLIPGSVGAAPVQNIGAYGVEVKDRIQGVRALHMPSMTWENFTVQDCEFSYRNSFFKRTLNEYAITSVNFSLGEKCALQTEYASLNQYLEHSKISHPTAKIVSEAVISIRQSRLPDPKKLGNAGSFFHNPIITENEAMALEMRFPGIVSYPAGKGLRKLSAAWMIDQAGFKGLQHGGVGVYEKQALVLVNLGSGSGLELLAFARSIQKTIKQMFSVQLSIEPIIH